MIFLAFTLALLWTSCDHPKLGGTGRGETLSLHGLSPLVRTNPTLFSLPFSFGPDPYLTGEAAYETINGVQSVGVQACAKHFLANNQEHWRYGMSADLDDRTSHELYMYPYYRAVEVSHPFRSFPSSSEAVLTTGFRAISNTFIGRRLVCHVLIQPRQPNLCLPQLSLTWRIRVPEETYWLQRIHDK